MIETVVELEKTKRKGDTAKTKGSKKGNEDQPFYPKKLVIGNKKDLQAKIKQDEITLKDMQEIGKLGINCKFVSALNNQEITTAFMKLVQELNQDQSLEKENIRYNEELIKLERE